MSFLSSIDPHPSARIGVVCCSGSLSREAAAELGECGFGHPHVVGLAGVRPADILKMFEEDPATEAIVIAGELNQDIEQACAECIARQMKKPVLGFVDRPVDCGVTRRDGVQGIQITHSPAELGECLQALLGARWLPFD
ncbi:MAG TPA: hypothetical protein VLA16_15670 [Ideonella sp.]|nr:hypothetical protein [Ideonella sp.]